MSSQLEWAGVLSGPVGAAVGAYGRGLFDRFTNKPKIDADAAKIIADTAVTLVAPLRQQVLELAERVEVLESERSAALDYIRVLLRWAGIEVPDKRPPQPPLLLQL